MQLRPLRNAELGGLAQNETIMTYAEASIFCIADFGDKALTGSNSASTAGPAPIAATSPINKIAGE